MHGKFPPRTPQQEAISVGMKAAWKRRKNEAREKPEQDLQIAAAAFLRLALRPPTIWTAFPAGGGGALRGAFLKSMGLQPGWSDFLFFHPHVVNTAIELKAEEGRQSKEQRTFEIAWMATGGIYYIARSVDEVERFLRAVGIPLHATTGSPALDFVRIKRVG